MRWHKKKYCAYPEEEPNGITSAIRDFNEYCGPARIFYNRNSHTFETRCYKPDGEKWFGEMMNNVDIVELYRKTTKYGNIKVTKEELLTMEREVKPYAVW